MLKNWIREWRGRLSERRLVETSERERGWKRERFSEIKRKDEKSGKGSIETRTGSLVCCIFFSPLSLPYFLSIFTSFYFFPVAGYS